MRPEFVISTFPPKHCGIGRYASQHVGHIRSSGGAAIPVAIDQPSDGAYRVVLHSIGSMAKFWGTALRERPSRVTLNYVDGFIHNGHRNPLKRYATYIMQAYLFLFLRLAFGFDIICHEIDTTRGDRRTFWNLHRKILFRHLCSRVFLHTDADRASLAGFIGLSADHPKLQLLDHARFFSKAFDGSREEARRHLGLPSDETIFVCLGFIGPHKGFDRAIRAFSGLPPETKAHLYVVGSIREPAPRELAHLDELKTLAAEAKNATLIERYLTDEDFDRWIAASDAVVLPYRHIWTSGVGARAAMFSRPVFYSDIPQLRSQFRGTDHLAFDSEEQLAFLAADFAGRASPREEEAISAHRPHAAKRILCVAYLYGGNVRGGAEGVLRRFVGLMRDLGHTVEVWSTATDSLEPRNDNLIDETEVDDVRVRRFPTNLKARRLFRWAHRWVQRRPRNPLISRLWVHASPYGLGMREALQAEQGNYDIIYLFHYHSGAAHRLADVAPLKTILHPWIHDEAILKSRAVARLFARPALVTLNSAEEADVAIRARVGFSTVRTAVIGNPVDPLAPEGEVSPQVREAAAQPYVLFIGRIIAEKNLVRLLDWHAAANTETGRAIRLLAVGRGPLLEKLGPRENVLQLEAVTESEKTYLLRRCLALANPSRLESFSLVIMEAWRAGRPVIVHEKCDTTAGHVRRSGGGHLAGDAITYARALDAVINDPQEAARMGEAGRRYVEDNFIEAAIARNLADVLDPFPPR